MDILDIVVVRKSAKAYTDAVIADLPNGFIFKGEVAYESDLPASADAGDTYAIKYTGSSGENPSGKKVAWGTKPDSTQGWIEVGGTMSAYRTAAAQDAIDSGKENASNKSTSISSASTDAQYPSAKCVYELVGDIESALEALL